MIIAAVLFAACGGEKPASPPPPQPSTAPAGQTRSASPPAPAAVAKKIDRSTPQHCAADGSYEQAVACFRQRNRLRFRSSDGSGEMTRRTPGAETLRVDVTRGADRGVWTATTGRSGVVWARNGKHATEVPVALQRLFQRMTLFPDPQKKESAAQKTGNDLVDREACNVYEFTDANSGDRYKVWVSEVDGRIVRARVGQWTLTLLD